MTQEPLVWNTAASAHRPSVTTTRGPGPGLASAGSSDCLCPASGWLCVRLTSRLHTPCQTEMLLPVAG